MKSSFISKEESVMLQGIAVYFMVVHHLLGFPERISVEYYNIFDFSFFHFETMLGYFGRICIALFAFISGYGIMNKINEFDCTGINILRKGYEIAFNHLKKFYLTYWIVFIVFIPYGMLTHTYTFQVTPFIKNLLGLSSTYNVEWWYVSFYLKMMLLFPIVFFLIEIVKDMIRLWGLLLLSGVGLCICLFGSGIPGHAFYCVFYCFLLGSLSVYLSVFEDIYRWIDKNKVIGYSLVLCSLCIVAIVRTFITRSTDYLLAPVFVFDFMVLLKCQRCPQIFRSILYKIGKKSTYIWLTHTFFAYYYWQKYLYACRFSVLIIMTCIICCMVAGELLERLKQWCFMYFYGYKKNGYIKE